MDSTRCRAGCRRAGLASLLVVAGACGGSASGDDIGARSLGDGRDRVASDRSQQPGLPAFRHPPLSAAAFLRHQSALAHDSMQGRGTGQEGGERAARYIARAYAAAGLASGKAGAGYRQRVPLRGNRVRVETLRAALIAGDGRRLALDAAQLSVRSVHAGARVALEAPLVFAAHGISSSVRDDYAGTDARGAIVVALPGAPAELARRLPGAGGAYELSDAGKVAAARRHEARGLLFLSAPGSEEQFESGRRAAMGREDLHPGWRPPPGVDLVLGLGPRGTAELLALAGLSWDDVAAGADAAADLRLALRLETRTREFHAPNLVGVVEGRLDETIVVTAHYDAYGIGPPDASGDSIYNGAADNASGTAALLELARALVARPEPPSRTVVFVATTAEEEGMLGARYWLDEPWGATGPIRLNLNADGVGFRPPTNDFVAFPVAGTDALSALSALAAPLGMTHATQPWHEGMHFAFDTAEFLARGIVGLTVWQGQDVRPEHRSPGGGSGSPIHSPADEMPTTPSEDGISQHLELYWRILTHYADGAPVPAFSEGHPFDAIAGALGGDERPRP